MDAIFQQVVPALTRVTQSFLISRIEHYWPAPHSPYMGIRVARMVNGEIVTDSESDDGENYLEADKRKVIAKRVEILRRQTRRLLAKKIALKQFPSKKTPKCVRGNLTKFPDIGGKFVIDIGADHWRRTAVVMFDGN